MNLQTPQAILESICDGREDLLTLGRKFNEAVSQNTSMIQDAKELATHNDSAKAIFQLDDIGLSETADALLSKLDLLAWSDEQRREFLIIKGRGEA